MQLKYLLHTLHRYLVLKGRVGQLLSDIPTNLLCEKVGASGLFPKNEVGLAVMSQGRSFQGEEAMPGGRFVKCV